MRILIAALAILILPACTSMLLGNNNSREPVPAGSSNPAQSSDDSAISASIRERFNSDPDVSRYAIGIRTRDNVVTLSGTVGSYPTRDRAVRIARDTDGVERVDNRIVVNTNL